MVLLIELELSFWYGRRLIVVSPPAVLTIIELNSASLVPRMFHLVALGCSFDLNCTFKCYSCRRDCIIILSDTHCQSFGRFRHGIVHFWSSPVILGSTIHFYIEGLTINQKLRSSLHRRYRYPLFLLTAHTIIVGTTMTIMA